MTSDIERIVDRRRLKRRLTFWRAAAVLALVLLVAVSVRRFDGVFKEDHVVRLVVDGLILDDPRRDDALAKVATDDKVKALLVRINSPGGTVVGGEALFRGLRRVAAEKPVVALMAGTATSAGYMTALGADRIIARQGTVTGSIGVLMQTTDITGLLKSIGVKSEIIKSRPLKAQPNPLEPLTPQARQASRDVVLDLYGMFVDMVVERRGMDREKALKLADGRVYTGRQAKANGLVDALGGEAEARDWLAASRRIPRSLPTQDLEVDRPGGVWRDLVFGAFQGIMGKSLFSERLRLDGLISVWHPDPL